MTQMLSMLIRRLEHPDIQRMNVIPWGCPIPAFGDAARASLATVGLNPSNREFLSVSGAELDGPVRRFHTLKSLGLNRWSEAGERHLKLISEACETYFSKNPYDGWFKRLDQVISATSRSYYNEQRAACHLDLIPYATSLKWTELSSHQQSTLLRFSGDALGRIIQDSPIRVLVLNGSSVIKHFEFMAAITLERCKMAGWSLRRRSRPPIDGIAYQGTITALAGQRLNREILVLGFNHNIQSSFGVTTEAVRAISAWIGRAAAGCLP
jgi:hypothetical protein